MVHTANVTGAILTMLLIFPFTSISQPGKYPAEVKRLLDSAERMVYSDFYETDAVLARAERFLTDAGVEKYRLAWIDLNNLRAMACIQHSKFSQTIKYLDRSITALEKYRGQFGVPVDSLWYGTLFLKSLYLSDIGIYDSALLYLSEIEAYYKAKPKTKKTCRELYGISQYQANIYDKKGEYESAINGYLASKYYYDCYRNPVRCPNYVLTYRNAGEAFLKKGDIENALINLWKGRKNLDSCLSTNDRVLRTHAVILYESFGQLYTIVKELDSAELYLQKAIPLLNDNPSFAYRIYKLLASIERARGNFQRALELLNKTLSFLTEYHGNKHRMSASVYLDMSEIYVDMQNYDLALATIQDAINALSQTDQVGSDPSDNPSLLNIVLRREMVDILKQKSTVLLKAYAQNSNQDLLHICNETSKLSLQLLDSMRHDFTLEKDKVILGEEAVKMFETSIIISLELYRQSDDIRYLRECFELMDRSKGAVLLDHLKLVRSFSGVPSDILERERQLKAELTIAEEQLFKAESRGKDASRERESLGDLKKDYARLFSEIKTYYPAYYKLRIENKSISFNEAQSGLLGPGQALVEYFLGDTSVFIMSITHADANLHSVSYPSIRNDVVKLKNLIARSNASPADIQQLSNTLYNKLVSPWIKQLEGDITSLIIIPHGVLSYLPFEMLSDGNNMLLNRFRISYASSASLLAEQKQMTVAGSSFAGFNAEYRDHDIFQPLIGSQNELNSIRKNFDGNTTVFFNSTADQFRQHAPDFKVLHLALHSFINDEKPLFSKLVFSTDSSGNTTEITANELYAMQLNAELAVLSACESGIGKLHKGEGMMSLSRAFMYAGVPSTVISLWKVPDHATARIMEKFYTFLKEGQRKDEALANAKRSFIKEYPEMSSPYFWAGFIVNGKSDPITFSVFESVQWSRFSIIVLFVATILTAIIQWRRHQTKAESVQAFVNQR